MLTDERVRKLAAEFWGVTDKADVRVIEVCNELLQLRAERVAWESTGDAALGDLAEIQVERDALRKELAALRRTTYCAYCGEQFPTEQVDSAEQVGAHIATCPEHPMRELEADWDALREELEKLTGECMWEVGQLLPDYDGACGEAAYVIPLESGDKVELCPTHLIRDVERAHDTVFKMEQEWRDVRAENAALQAKLDRVVGALQRYGSHDVGCPHNERLYTNTEGKACDCGLTAALAEEGTDE